jgi:hypothetical protein
MENAIFIDQIGINNIEETNFVENILRLFKGIPKSKYATEIGRKKELKLINDRFMEKIIKNQEEIIELITNIFTNPSLALNLSNKENFNKDLDEKLKPFISYLNECEKILKKMTKKEKISFIIDELDSLLAAIEKSKEKTFFKNWYNNENQEDVFILGGYLTFIENILTNLISDIKFNDEVSDNFSDSLYVLLFLLIALLSFYKKKISMEKLENFKTEIMFFMYKKGITNLATYYG